VKQRNVGRIASDTVYTQASERLHVSAVPQDLPCREEEYAELYSHLENAIQDAAGTCICKIIDSDRIDVSGVPGTGKTATFRAVLRQLQEQVDNEELEPFEFVEINGMRLSEPQQAYTALWEGLTGERVSPSHAEELLSDRFNNPSRTTRPCVVLMDELDLLVTKKQKVVYNFFNWPNGRYSQLIVVAIANTMDLPERMLSNKVSSRLGKSIDLSCRINPHDISDIQVPAAHDDYRIQIGWFELFFPRCDSILC
jgi:origin recognition complex subunit 1